MLPGVTVVAFGPVLFIVGRADDDDSRTIRGAAVGAAIAEGFRSIELYQLLQSC